MEEGTLQVWHVAVIAVPLLNDRSLLAFVNKIGDLSFSGSITTAPN